MSTNDEKNESSGDNVSTETADDMSIGQKRAYIIYQQASKHIKDIKFIIELLNIAKDYNNTEKLQNKIVR